MLAKAFIEAPRLFLSWPGSSKSNEALLKLLNERNIERDIANVKIIGPLRHNIALINVRPLPSPDVREEIADSLSSIEEIDEISWVDGPLTLVARANLGQYRNPSSLYWLRKREAAARVCFSCYCLLDALF